ncbi:MAG: diphosphomevalonate decarboxylase [Cytophagales bacterium]|nr:diphosphomevalonate decarboxylase [Bernardetiaceae bacterium]MDW8211340.1 diphosphomevalonate decarboxylase [Cytophagales bacterium]
MALLQQSPKFATTIASTSLEHQQGHIHWRVPSNIALIKYWGKRGVQLPQNPSLSFTLQHAYTEMQLDFRPSSTGKRIVEFYFEGMPNEKFRAKIVQFLETYPEEFTFTEKLHLTFHSINSFPHSAGIASSASSMGALALCLVSLAQKCGIDWGRLETTWQKASYWARLASGSACRSIYGGYVLWGAVPELPHSSDLYALPLSQENIHPIFANFCDSILIISAEEKAVSSRAGHALMNGHPFAEARYQQARTHLKQLLEALAMGNLEKFITIVENEALTLHGLMMNSYPSFILMKPATLAVIEQLRNFRRQREIPLAFTLDAGPNVHVLYPAAFRQEVRNFIDEELVKYCQQNRYIHDEVGTGPILFQ